MLPRLKKIILSKISENRLISLRKHNARRSFDLAPQQLKNQESPSTSPLIAHNYPTRQQINSRPVCGAAIMKIFGREVAIAKKSLWKRKDASVRAVAPEHHVAFDKATSIVSIGIENGESIIDDASIATDAADEETTSSNSFSTTKSSPPETATQLSPPSQSLSQLSVMVSKFISENARKTHNSIKDEKERRDFAFDLKETLKSLRSGSERPPRRSPSAVAHVIDFFAEATESTLFYIESEEERIDFEEHLTKELFQNLQYNETAVSTTSQ